MAIGGQLANPRKHANRWIVEGLSGCKDPNSGRWLSYNWACDTLKLPKEVHGGSYHVGKATTASL
jgi:hypothetical protein